MQVVDLTRGGVAFLIESRVRSGAFPAGTIRWRIAGAPATLLLLTALVPGAAAQNGSREPDGSTSLTASAAPLSSGIAPGVQPVPRHPYAPKTPGDYRAITGHERLDWFARRTVGWQAIGVGLVNAGFNTAIRNPEEWPGTWEGFGKRFGTRSAQVAISSGIEASLGAMWGEDPRYFRSGKSGTGGRIWYAVTSSFLTYREDGRRHLAWARFAGMAGGRAITNQWRPPSDRAWFKYCFQPLGTGVGFRITSNLLHEFWPDLRAKFRK